MSIINRETDYALRVIRSLKEGKTKSVDQITREQSFAKPFAYKIIKKLENKGYVKITKGPGGGVTLDCDLTKETLFGLMETVENHQYVNDCFKPNYKCENQDCSRCATHKILLEWQSSLDAKLKELKLSAMV